MQGMLQLNEKWWFGAVIGSATMLGVVALAMTIGLSFEAGGVVVSLDPSDTYGLQLTILERSTT